MAFSGFDKDLGIPDFLHFSREQCAKLFANGGLDASGPAVGDNSFLIQGAEVGAGSDVSGAQFKPKPKRFDDPTADLELQRVIAEEAQMTGPAARGNPRRDGNHPALSRY